MAKFPCKYLSNCIFDGIVDTDEHTYCFRGKGDNKLYYHYFCYAHDKPEFVELSKGAMYEIEELIKSSFKDSLPEWARDVLLTFEKHI